jgi:hypothetical protein
MPAKYDPITMQEVPGTRWEPPVEDRIRNIARHCYSIVIHSNSTVVAIDRIERFIRRILDKEAS